VIIEHDEINLTKSASIIGSHMLEALFFQPYAGSVLTMLSEQQVRCLQDNQHLMEVTE
jgi:hypothetical protein